MSHIIFRSATIYNEGTRIEGDLYIKDDIIQQIGGSIDIKNAEEVNCEGLWLMPGVIDDQVHYREPGLTHKADIASESRAAIAGGVTTFMEMPNTKPATLTQKLLEDKYQIGARNAYCNYSFFMGASNDNLDEVLKTDPKTVCGVKIFMGSSTGNMLVDDTAVLDKLFANVPMLIATHCEDESTVRANEVKYQEIYGDRLNASHHPIIRNVEACYLSSSKAIDLAKKHNTRLHILHISTAKETELFRNDIPLSEKRITSEACVHHMYFNDQDYLRLGNQIKCNPAIKTENDRAAIFQALLDDRIDIIATDHAPHTWEEKSQPFMKAPSGLPLIQHPLYLMMDFVDRGHISMERVVEKMCHAPATCFQIAKRGFLKEGFKADIVLIDPKQPYMVDKSNILYKCGWSPLEGKRFSHSIVSTYVNGIKVFDLNSQLFRQGYGQRLSFNR